MPDVSTQDIDLGVGSTNLGDPGFRWIFSRLIPYEFVLGIFKASTLLFVIGSKTSQLLTISLWWGRRSLWSIYVVESLCCGMFLVCLHHGVGDEDRLSVVFEPTTKVRIEEYCHDI
jgi:hypothetical protein